LVKEPAQTFERLIPRYHNGERQINGEKAPLGPGRSGESRRGSGPNLPKATLPVAHGSGKHSAPSAWLICILHEILRMQYIDKICRRVMLET
jgi:hypothetical protein